MRTLLILGTAVSAILLGSTNLQASEPAQHAVSNAVAQTAVASTNLQDWRMRYYNGQWWYWNPGNYWMTYNNGAWSRYGGVGVGANAYVGPRYNNYYRGYPNYGYGYRYGNPYYGYRGYPYYGGYRGYPYDGGYRGYGPGGVAGRAAVRIVR